MTKTKAPLWQRITLAALTVALLASVGWALGETGSMAGMFSGGTISGATTFQDDVTFDGSAGDALWDASAGRLGIGTATPAQLLDVNGTVLSKAVITDQIRVGVNNQVYIEATSSPAAQLAIYPGGVVVNELANDQNFRIETVSNIFGVFVDAGLGFVGIGTGTPITELHVAGDILADDIKITTDPLGSNRAVISRSTTSNNTIQIVGGTDTFAAGNDAFFNIAGKDFVVGPVFSISGGTQQGDTAAGESAIKGITASATGTGSNQNGGNVRMLGGTPSGAGTYGDVLLAWDGSTARGNVGVGTGTPTEPLHVEGRATFSGAIRPGRILSTTPTEPFACSASTVGYMVYVDDTDDAGPAAMCLCLDADDGTTLDWRRVDDNATACPFF